MEWKKLSKREAKQKTGEWNSLSKDAFAELKADWKNTILTDLNPDYTALRKELISAFNRVVDTVNNHADKKERKGYLIDSQFGMELYRILNRYDFSLRYASTDDFWIYLCVAVCPDIVQNRFPGKKSKDSEDNEIFLNINEDRFWKNSRRIYLKQIWWYIHLSYTGNLSL